jgi:DNA polymerase V
MNKNDLNQALLENLKRPAPLADTRPGSPLFGHSVNAGFPSPAEDYIEDYLDLHKLMVHNPPATFFLKVKGSSMIEAGVRDGDLLVVDRSLSAVHGKIVVAALDGELTVKRLKIKNGQIFLAPENDQYPALEITDREDAVIWGVVTYVVHKV